MVELVRAIPSHTLQMHSVEDRQAAPMFKTLQLGVYQGRVASWLAFQSSPESTAGIWLNHPKGGSSMYFFGPSSFFFANVILNIFSQAFSIHFVKATGAIIIIY